MLAQPLKIGGSTSVSMTNTGRKIEGITRATIGKGNIEIADGSDISGLNRDINNIQEITRDEITGALDASLTVDNRWFTEEGRESISKDLEILDVIGNSRKAAEETGHVPHLFTSLWITDSVTGQDYYEKDSETLAYTLDNGEKKLTDDAENRGILFKYVLSDESPVLKFFSHIVPSVFSSSMGHDHKMHQETKQLIKETGDRNAKLDQSYLIGTIPDYFMRNLANSIGTMIDVPNWQKNYNLILKDFNRNKPQQTPLPK